MQDSWELLAVAVVRVLTEHPFQVLGIIFTVSFILAPRGEKELFLNDTWEVIVAIVVLGAVALAIMFLVYDDTARWWAQFALGCLMVAGWAALIAAGIARKIKTGKFAEPHEPGTRRGWWERTLGN